MGVMKFKGTMLANLFKKPVTTKYPAEPVHYPEGSRGHIEIEIEKCISCTLCAMNCPSGAIKVDRKARTWEINRMDCVQCGYCTMKCPKKCLHIVEGYTKPDETKQIDRFVRPPDPPKPDKPKPAAAAAKPDAAAKPKPASVAAAKPNAAAKPKPAPAAAAKPAEAEEKASTPKPTAAAKPATAEEKTAAPKEEAAEKK